MSTTNPLDALVSQQATTDTAQPTTAQSQPAPNPLDQLATPIAAQKNPLDSLASAPQTSTPNPAGALTNPLDSLGSANPLESLGGPQRDRTLSPDESDYASKKPDEMDEENEPWYHRAWEWLNSPLWDLHKYGTREGAGNFERGLETGLEDIASGFTSPLQIGLTLATFGGGAVEEAGIGALRAIGVTEKLAPVVAAGAKTLASAGFTTQMIGGLVTQVPQFLDALKDGDVEEATRLGTDVTIGAYIAKGGLKAGVEDLENFKENLREYQGKPRTVTDKLKDFSKIAGDYSLAKQQAADAAKARDAQLRKQLADTGEVTEERQAGITHWITQGADDAIERCKKLYAIATGSLRAPERMDTADEAFENDHVFVAVDRKNMDNIRNAGILPGEYHSTPEEAIKNAKLPDSGSYKDLTVLAVPRREVETGIHADKSTEEFKAQKGQLPAHMDLLSQEKNLRFSGEKLSPIQGVDTSEAQAPGWEGKPTLNYRITVHDAEGNEVGSITLGVEQGKPAVVGDIFVKENYRQRGIGTKLYEQAASAAKSLGAKQLESGQIGTNVEAIRRWERMIDEHKITKTKEGYVWNLNEKGVAKTDLKPWTTERPVAGPQELGEAPHIEGSMKTNRMHMPSHEIMMDRDTPTGAPPEPTSQARPLRIEGAENLPQDNARFQALTQEKKDAYLKGLDYAINHMTDADKDIAAQYGQLYRESFLKAYEHGLIRQWVEAYHPQAWANQKNSLWSTIFKNDPEQVTNPALNQLRDDTNSGRFDTNVNAAQHRAYNTEFQGVMAGQTVKTRDLAFHASRHIQAIDEAIAARKFIDDLRASGLKGQDGRPAVVMTGSARKFGGDDNPAVAVTGNVKPRHISPEIIQLMQEGHVPGKTINALEEALQKGHIEKIGGTNTLEDGTIMPRYGWTGEGFESINHPTMRAWGYIGQDTAGNNVIYHGEMRVHPDFVEPIRQIIGAEEPSMIRKNPYLNTALGASREAKGILFSLSPFHLIQEGMRAVMLGVNPFKWDHININDDPDLQIGVRNGLERNMFQSKDEYSGGYASHSKLISKIPGLNRFQAWQQEFLFEKVIPSFKDRAFKDLFHKIQDSDSSITPDEAAARAASLVNDTFGGQNWRKLGINAATQDFMKMTMLAPDWLISELRMTARVLGLHTGDATGILGGINKADANYLRIQMGKQVAGMWLVARALNMVTNGQMHNEAPFGVVSKNEKGDETVYSLRTLPTDVIHFVSDPGNFIRGRVNPLVVKPAVEFLSGRDELGRRADYATQARDAYRGIMPISAQGLMRENALPWKQQLAKGLGGNVYRYRTEAEKLANQYASDRMPSGPVNPEELHQHQKEMQLEDAYRAGQITKADLNRELPKRRVTDITRRVGMNALQARFDRLPMSEAINVWNAATNAEKEQLHTQLWKKRQAWLKQHKPAERAGEPVWRKMQATWGDLR